jgi:hypothetical protein
MAHPFILKLEDVIQKKYILEIESLLNNQASTLWRP